MAIDTHLHINHTVLDKIQEEIADINQNPHIERVINVGLNISTSNETVAIAKENIKFYSTVGIHPLYIESQNLASIINLAQNDKVIAIGEIGLDDTKKNDKEQKEYFIKQIMIANHLNLPIVIHANHTNQQVIEIFEKYVKPQYGCVFHCFQPDRETLNYLINHDYLISFAGRITYKTAKKSIEIAKLIPNELFLVETDSPYIAPEPLRGEKNKSSNIKWIIEKLAEVKEMNYEEVEKITTQNAKRLFKKIK